MECGYCNETIEEDAGFLCMPCSHNAHLSCYTRLNAHNFYHARLAHVHCAVCQEQTFNHEFIQEIEDEINERTSQDNSDDLLEERWKQQPKLKEKVKLAIEAKRDALKKTREFNKLTTKIVTDLKKETEGTIHVLRGMYKSAYMKLMNSAEAKAAKSAKSLYYRRFERLLDDFNTNRWQVIGFLRKKGFRIAGDHPRYSVYQIRRKFSVKLL
jgi:hypothetical protein